MFENLSYYALQQYWWGIISLLAALLVFLMFVQGGQTFIFQLGKTPTQKSLIINALGHKWEFGFTTLVTFGGAFFASFPLFYSTSFGGAYWVWMLLLLCFVIQAVSYEYRRKPNNLLGQNTFDIFLFINGSLGVFVLGVAVGTFFTGSAFSVDMANISNNVLNENVVISSWQGHFGGLEALLNITNLLLGFALVFLTRSLGLLFFMNRIEEPTLFKQSKKHLFWNALLFLVFFLSFLVSIMMREGYAIDEHTHEVYMQTYKYFFNFIEMPCVGILFVIGVISVLLGIGLSICKDTYRKGIWFAGLGTILTVFALFLNVGLNHTAYYPSTYYLQNSLTIENSSSSKFTLVAMGYVSLFIPFVLAYIGYVWYKMTSKLLTKEEIQKDLNDESEVY
ncbi:MAG: cytochrome d ubiquinol oxidase subunit II [Bacteroidales bacterium]